MTATSGWSPGRLQASYGSAGFTLNNFNALANGSCAVSAVVDNSTALDQYCDVSFSFIIGTATTSSSYVVLFILPLNQDSTTYGDGATAGGATVPSAGYQRGQIGVATVASGSVTGSFELVGLPRGKFVFVIQNQLGNALNSTAGAAASFRTYNDNMNA